ncbi:hypothetical protein Daus18300_013428 [Diaporthe australafricana]|uniref:Xylanolytic transcriptional activator regulatory domain-containing protein n=1 Tax=Diaporthe australafricana TaxID=127596 RepID=A0ABR3VZ10_9PEZI
MGSPAEVEIIALLPSLAPATLLVDNYFEKVHWFMLVFHQSEFRGKLRELYSNLDGSFQRQHISLGLGLGFISVFAAVCIVSLRYIDNRQRTQLTECGIQPDVLQQKLLSTLRLRLLDIVSRGSIEAVQVCVLLGSFHLYHGEPELAWPICGCGLRIAQALNLHRRRPEADGPSSPDLDDPRQRAEETRKRCWWAVYEIETTCSMLYGFPLSINDDDCDLQLLNPYPVRSGDPSWDPVIRQETGQATLLSYKHAMAQLSIIVKSVLTDLYGLRRRRVPTSGNFSTADRHRLHSLMAIVKSLDERLHEWHARLPRQLRPASLNDAEDRPLGPFSNSDRTDELTSAVFQRHLFQLQALALKVAFENAKILIHRPLLSNRMIIPPTTNAGTPISTTSDTCQSSMQVCRDAALEISNIGSLPVFQGIADTYAVSFVSLHLLTAAIALSILTTLTPLTQESHDCKMGIRRLMEMQSRLRARSIVAKQGLGILKKLMALVLKKEMKQMLEFPRSTDEVEVPAEDEAIRDDNINRSSRNSENERALSVHHQAETETHPEACHMRSHTDGQSADQIAIDSSELLISDPGPGAATTPGFNFYEDPIITQALLDFEEGPELDLGLESLFIAEV